MQPTVLGGPAEVAISGITIPPSLLSEVKTQLKEGTRSRNTLGGKFSNPSGTLDTAEVTFTLYLPSMDYLKSIFPGRYNTPTAPQTTGNVIFNANTSVVAAPGPVNVHYTAEANDNNDVYLYNAQALLDFSGTFNAADDLSIGVTLYAQPDSNGNVFRLGTGDLTAVSKYDAATKTTVAA